MDRGERSRATRDEAGVGPHLREGVRLVPLRELGDVRLADGEPDIRGWELRTVSGRVLGTIEELLVDEADGEVVLLDVAVPAGEGGAGRRSLAPIRAIQLDRTRRVALIDSTELRDAAALPSFASGGALTADDVRVFRDDYQRTWGANAWHSERDYHIARGGEEMRLGRGELTGDRRTLDREALADAREAVADDARRAHPAHHETLPPPTPLAAPLPPAPERAPGQVRYPRTAATHDEVVVERRPVVMEEVVVRRREVDPASTDAPVTRAADRAAEPPLRRDDDRRP